MGFSKENIKKASVLYKATAIFPGPLSVHGLQNNFWEQTYWVLRVNEEIIQNTTGGQMKIPKDILLFVGTTTLDYERKNYSNLEVFLPNDIKKALIQNNEEEDIDDIFLMQKAYVQNWENRNFYITSVDGKASEVSDSRLKKLQEALKNEESIPKFGTLNGNLFFASEKPLNSISFEAQSEEKRKNQKKIQKAIQLKFMVAADIRYKQIQNPWLTGIDFNESLPIYDREIKNSRRIKYAKGVLNGENFIFASKEKTYKINALDGFGIIPADAAETVDENDLILLEPLTHEEINELYNLCMKPTSKDFSSPEENMEMEILINGNKVPENFAIYKIMKDSAILLENLVYDGAKVPMDKNPRSTCLFSKFIINPNSKIIFNSKMQIVSQGFPLAIESFDDYPHPCQITPSLESFFFDDFRKNYKNYLENYPILKKLASFAIFIGIILHNQTITKQRAAMNIEEYTDPLKNQQAANPLLNIPYTWKFPDLIILRYHFFKALLEIQTYHLFKFCDNNNKAEKHFIRKQIVLFSCLEILRSCCIFNIGLTNGEKKLLQTMFSIDKSEDDEIVFSLAGIVIQLALKEGYLRELQPLTECIMLIMDKKEKELTNNSKEEMEIKNCWKILLSHHDRSTIQNGIEFVELLNKIMFDGKIKNGNMEMYSKLKRFQNSIEQKRPSSTLKMSFLNDTPPSENVGNQKIIYLSAFGYQFISVLWMNNHTPKTNQSLQEFLEEFYIHISYFIRSLSAFFYMIKNENEANNKKHWITATKYCIKQFQSLLKYGNEESAKLKKALKTQKIANNLKHFYDSPNKKIGQKLIKDQTNLHFLYKIDGKYDRAEEISTNISEIYAKLEDFNKSEAWKERAKIDKKKAIEKLKNDNSKLPSAFKKILSTSIVECSDDDEPDTPAMTLTYSGTII